MSQTPDLSRRRFLGWTGGAGAAVLLAACSAPSSSTDKKDKVAKSSKDVDKIAFDYPFTFLPVYAGVTKFAKARAKEVGVDLTQTSDNGRPDVQASNLDTVIAQKVPAIVSFPMVFEALETPAARCRTRAPRSPSASRRAAVCSVRTPPRGPRRTSAARARSPSSSTTRSSSAASGPRA